MEVMLGESRAQVWEASQDKCGEGNSTACTTKSVSGWAVMFTCLVALKGVLTNV